MAQKNGIAENQHYVPQFLLRNFSFRKKSKKGGKEEQYIYAFDKHTDKAFTPNIKGIASETGFYNFYVGEEDRSLEPSLAELENKTQEGIKKLIETENLGSLNYEDKAWISLFVAIQYLRVKKQREALKQFTNDMSERVKSMGINPEELDGFEKLTDEQIKIKTLESFAKDSPLLSQLISNKICLLFKSPKGYPLYISDNPVVMHNDENFMPYGNIGFAVPGIQIYLPISTSLCLAFWCPSLEAKFHDNWTRLNELEEKLKVQLLLNPRLCGQKI